jgi:hypothetical protein
LIYVLVILIYIILVYSDVLALPVTNINTSPAEYTNFTVEENSALLNCNSVEYNNIVVRFLNLFNPCKTNINIEPDELKNTFYISRYTDNKPDSIKVDKKVAGAGILFFIDSFVDALNELESLNSIMDSKKEK